MGYSPVNRCVILYMSQFFKEIMLNCLSYRQGKSPRYSRPSYEVGRHPRVFNIDPLPDVRHTFIVESSVPLRTSSLQ